MAKFENYGINNSEKKRQKIINILSDPKTHWNQKKKIKKYQYSKMLESMPESKKV